VEGGWREGLKREWRRREEEERFVTMATQVQAVLSTYGVPTAPPRSVKV
jgi:hypothetical protein